MRISPFSYFRAFLTVTICYGLALAEDYFEGGAVFRVSAMTVAMPISGWPMFLALWLMLMVHMPLPAYYWVNSVQLNSCFSNESVFKAIFTAWYGGIALMGFLAMVIGTQYGWIFILSLLLAGLGLVRRGVRLRQIAGYGSTCASLFVFYLVSDEVPPRLWWLFYLGIGLVQCVFLAFLEMVFNEIFPAMEIPGDDSSAALAPPAPPAAPPEVGAEPQPAAPPDPDESLKITRAG